MVSHGALAFGIDDPLVSPHPTVLALSMDPAHRRQAYRDLVMASLEPGELLAIREHLQCQHPYGSERFRTAIEAQIGRTAGPQKIGRPRKRREERESRLCRLLLDPAF